MTLIFIGIILILLFIIAFAFYMAASDYRKEHDWRSKREDYLDWKLPNEEIKL